MHKFINIALPKYGHYESVGSADFLSEFLNKIKKIYTNMNNTAKNKLVFFLGAFCAILFFFGATTVNAAGPNLIQNGDMASSTSGTMPDFFTTGGYGVSSSTFLYPVEGPSGA